MKKLIAGILLVLIATSVSVSAATTKTDVGQLTVNPTKPAPKATVTYSVVLNSPATAAQLWYHECRVAPNAMCYQAQTVNMTGTGTHYSVQVTYGHSDATYVVAHVLVKNGSSWIEGQDFNVTLNTQTNNSGNNTHKKGTPGFEIVPVLAAVGIVLLLMRKKRS